MRHLRMTTGRAYRLAAVLGLAAVGTVSIGSIPLAAAHGSVQPNTFPPVSGYTVPNPPTPQQVNTAVTNGVNYIDCQQNADGSFGTGAQFGYTGGNVPETAAAIIAYGVLDKGKIANLPTNQTDPVCSASPRNFQAHLTKAVVWLLGQQDTTDPKGVNLNGGAWFINRPGYQSLQTYSTGLALSALSLSSTVPTTPANAIATAVGNGRTFLVNEFQNSNGGTPPVACSTSTTGGAGTSYYCGGWNYYPGNTRSDQSNTGYAMTGLHSTGGVPAAIQALNLGWENNVQSLTTSNPYWTKTYQGCTSNCPNDGGSGYEPYEAAYRGSGQDFSGNANDSGTNLFSYADDGLTVADARADAALQFGTDILDTYEKAANSVANEGGPHVMVYHTGVKEDGSCVPGTTTGGVTCDWAYGAGEGGFHYSMFALAKGMGAFIPANLSDGKNWYAKLADLLVHEQNKTACNPAAACSFGSWPADLRDDFSVIFSTGLSIFALGLVATPPPPVQQVTAVTASTNCTQITFNWTNPTTPNYGGVIIQRSTTHVPTSPTDGTRLADVARPGTTFTDKGLVSGTTYYYGLFAHDTSGQAFAAAVPETVSPKCAPPPQVGHVTVSAQCALATFTWTNPTTPNYAGLIIERSTTRVPTSPTDGTRLADVARPGTTFTDNGLVSGKTYYFGLFAHDPSGKAVSAAVPETVTAKCPLPNGYRLEAGDGGLFAFHKSFVGSIPPPSLGLHVFDIVAMAALKDGYWLVGADGGVFAFGTAKYRGSLPSRGIHVHDIVGVAGTPDGAGYWLVTNGGTIYAFGDAVAHGSLAGKGISDVVAISSPDAGGYWLVGRDGNVFPFGDAVSHGNCLTARCGSQGVTDIVGIANHGASGYWLAGKDGGVFAFGDSKYRGSCPLGGSGCQGASNIVGIASPDATGYWLAEATGKVLKFGDATFFGDCTQAHSGCLTPTLVRPMVAMTS